MGKFQLSELHGSGQVQNGQVLSGFVSIWASLIGQLILGEFELGWAKCVVSTLTWCRLLLDLVELD